jgi:hypothetical protein
LRLVYRNITKYPVPQIRGNDPSDYLHRVCRYYSTGINIEINL